MWMQIQSLSLTKKKEKEKLKQQKFESFTIKEKKWQLLNSKYKFFLTFCYGCVVHG